MTRKDDAPTFIAAISRKDGRLHLSKHGNYTLCHYLIRDHWQIYNERVPLFAIWLSGASVCSQCEKAATKEAAP
jgi:hypothetical protein